MLSKLNYLTTRLVMTMFLYSLLVSSDKIREGRGHRGWKKEVKIENKIKTKEFIFNQSSLAILSSLVKFPFTLSMNVKFKSLKNITM